MRTRAGLLKGGESEESALVPGKAIASPLYLAVTRAHEDDWSAMPPKENDKLSAEQIGYIKERITAALKRRMLSVWWRSSRKRSLGRDRWRDGENRRRTGCRLDQSQADPQKLWAYRDIQTGGAGEGASGGCLCGGAVPQGRRWRRRPGR